MSQYSKSYTKKGPGRRHKFERGVRGGTKEEFDLRGNKPARKAIRSHIAVSNP
jgi:hypothetical protein